MIINIGSTTEIPRKALRWLQERTAQLFQIVYDFFDELLSPELSNLKFFLKSYPRILKMKKIIFIRRKGFPKVKVPVF